MDSRKRFTLFRAFVLADLITLTNAGSGTAAILLCLNYLTLSRSLYLWAVLSLLILALLCDFLDGYVSRRSGKRSIFGADLDSLADIVSFGLAPAVLGFTLGLRGLWDALIFIYFVVCGISRLARFNATASQLADEKGKVRYYQGAPIPTSILIVVLLIFLWAAGFMERSLPFGAWVLGPGILHPLVLIYVLFGSAMISSIHLPKF